MTLGRMNPTTTETKKMSASSRTSQQSQSAGNAAGKGSMHAGDSELSAFNLRDTLSGIIVRETNFNEFLAVLKQFGMNTAKQ
jgi:hypothetical protein